MAIDITTTVAPISLMAHCERLALYAIVYAFQPRHVLEIGFWEGGSAAVMLTALVDAGVSATVSSIDIEPRLSTSFKEVRDRLPATVAFRLFTGWSSSLVLPASSGIDQPLEMALIDGDHSTQGAYSDIIAVTNSLAHGGYIVLHDAHYRPVNQAIVQALRERTDLVDCGMISRPIIDLPHLPGPWGGLHLLRRT